MNKEELEIEFQKFNLKENDCLVVRVNTANMTEEEAVNKLNEIREDSFLQYVEEKGNKVFVTYSGVKLEILRLEEGDKLAVYVNVTDMDDEKKEKYLDFIEHKMSALEDKVVILPIDNNEPQYRVMNNPIEEEV